MRAETNLASDMRKSQMMRKKTKNLPVSIPPEEDWKLTCIDPSSKERCHKMDSHHQSIWRTPRYSHCGDCQPHHSQQHEQRLVHFVVHHACYQRAHQVAHRGCSEEEGGCLHICVSDDLKVQEGWTLLTNSKALENDHSEGFKHFGCWSHIRFNLLRLV